MLLKFAKCCKLALAQVEQLADGPERRARHPWDLLQNPHAYLQGAVPAREIRGGAQHRQLGVARLPAPTRVIAEHGVAYGARRAPFLRVHDLVLLLLLLLLPPDIAILDGVHPSKIVIYYYLCTLLLLYVKA